MCNSQIDQLCCPITFGICEKADIYCSSKPGGPVIHRACCGPRGEPYCADCFCCLVPFGIVADVVCLPCNIYNICLKCQQEKQEKIGEKERRAFAI